MRRFLALLFLSLAIAPLSAGEPAAKADFDGLSKLLHQMAVKRLPKEIADDRNWGMTIPVPDKLPLPLKVHRRQGEPCPRCGAELAAVHYEDYVMTYCPAEQTDGRLLKDRRLSRLLK